MACVDVVVPCYQYGHFLRQCVRSVLTQDVQDVRVLIIDNASTDSTLEIARQLAEEDSRVEISAHRSNLGAVASFNEGIDWARADYFLVLCADDLLSSGALAKAVDLMERNPEVVFTYGAAEVITESGFTESIRNDNDVHWWLMPGRALLMRFFRAVYCHVPSPTAVVRTSAQRRAGYYRAQLPHSCDLEMWMRLACLGRVAETNCVQGYVRRHARNRSASV